jgi:hypothetical protein
MGITDDDIVLAIQRYLGDGAYAAGEPEEFLADAAIRLTGGYDPRDPQTARWTWSSTTFDEYRLALKEAALAQAERVKKQIDNGPHERMFMRLYVQALDLDKQRAVPADPPADNIGATDTGLSP